MLGQEPNLPVDFLLGRIPAYALEAISDWMQEHQARLRTDFEGAREHIEMAARLRKERHVQKVTNIPIAEGQVVYFHSVSISEIRH